LAAADSRYLLEPHSKGRTGLITFTLDTETVELRAREASHTDLVPFRAWALGGHQQIVGWLDLVGNEACARTPAPGAPSVLDVLRHLVPLRRRIARTCAALEHGDAPAAPEHRTLAKLPSMAWARMALDASQEELKEVVESLWPMTDLELRSEGYGVGPYNVKEWLAWQRLHDDEHLAEIENTAYLLGVHGATQRIA
jgi:uncharacterized damage-inducible protein DinB